MLKIGLVLFIRRHPREPTLSAHMHHERPRGDSGKVAICKPGSEPYQNPALPAAWSWNSSFQNSEKINICC